LLLAASELRTYLEETRSTVESFASRDGAGGNIHPCVAVQQPSVSLALLARHHHNGQASLVCGVTAQADTALRPYILKFLVFEINKNIWL